MPTRADAYAPHVEIDEITFETIEDYQTWQEQGREIAEEAINSGDFLIWVTGNHLGALPVYEVLGEIAAQEEKHQPLMVQLDAHLDVHHFADCSPEPSHGNFLLHCDSPPLINLGHRELLLPPDHIEQFFERAIPISLLLGDLSPIVQQIRRRCEQAGDVFLDLDCDCFDPVFFPAVKHPVPCGLTSQQVLQIIEGIWSPRLRGVIISEFAPDKDVEDRSLSLLVWLIEHMLLKQFEVDEGD